MQDYPSYPLRLLRKLIDTTQNDLAKQVEILCQSLMGYDNGRQNMKCQTYMALVLSFQQHEESKRQIELIGLFDESFFVTAHGVGDTY